jgi:hypothetical protein
MVEADFIPVKANLIPVNQKGKPGDLEYSIVFLSREEAAVCFKRAANRLRNPTRWHSLAGWASANFLLTDAGGALLSRLALEGDYLRIDIPGPGSNAGHGYDWVKVENIDDNISVRGEWEWIAMKVSPCPEPGKGGQDVAHFFRQEASSTFVLEKVGAKVTARYHGRNEEAQWSALIKGLLIAETGDE